MNFIKTFVALTLFVFITFSAFAKSAPSLTTKEFKKIIGCWKATLNYNSTMVRKPHVTRGSVRIKQVGRSSAFTFAYFFSEQSGDVWSDTLTVSKNGEDINGAPIKTKQYLRNGTLQIVTEAEGLDNESNRQATFRCTYVLGKKTCTYKKEVRLHKQEEWTVREEFKLTRKVCTGK